MIKHDELFTRGGMQYTKCFLHPDIVASYDYIFISDKDLGLDDFEDEKLRSLVELKMALFLKTNFLTLVNTLQNNRYWPIYGLRKTFPTLHLRTGKVIAYVTDGDAEDVNRAVDYKF
nr:putative protein of unknown function DUF707 [Tanacetum cinerariifolium]